MFQTVIIFLKKEMKPLPLISVVILLIFSSLLCMYKFLYICKLPFSPPGQMPVHCKSFYKKPFYLRHAEFLNYSLQEQFEFYICGMMYMNPPDDFSYKMAEQGKKIIPFLLQHLKNEKDEFVQELTIRIIDVMNSLYVDVSHDDELVNTLKKTISSMQNKWNRRASEEYLKEILKTTNLEKTEESPLDEKIKLKISSY